MEDLINAIQAVLDNPFAGRELPPMQERVAILTARGFSPREAADDIGISEAAVNKNRQYTAKKIGISASQFTKLAFNSIQAVLDNYRLEDER